MNCYQHPNTATLVSCGRCEKRICPQCMVSTSAGMRCPDCAYVSGYLPAVAASKSGSVGMVAAAGLLTGLAGALVTSLLAFIYPLLAVLTAPVYGRLVADSVASFSGDMKASRTIAIGVGSIMVGSLIAFGAPISPLRTTHGFMPPMTQAAIGLAVGLSVAFCYQRLTQRSS